jgi:hypothetical protein
VAGSENETATPETADADTLTLEGHAIANAGGGGGGGGGGVGVVGELHALRHAIASTRITVGGNFIGAKDQFYRVNS